MGCDIHIVAQKRDSDNNWVDVEGNFNEGPNPFDWRSYGMFAFLAGVRNYSDIQAISEPRDFPEDFELDQDELEYHGGEWMGDHSYSWLSVEELLGYDYDQIIEDRRVTGRIAPNLVSGSETCDEGDGEKLTLRDFLYPAYFEDLEELKNIGAERIVFGFDN